MAGDEKPIGINIGALSQHVGRRQHIIDFVIEHAVGPRQAVFAAQRGNHDDEAGVAKRLGLLPIVLAESEAAVEKQDGRAFLVDTIGRAADPSFQS